MWKNNMNSIDAFQLCEASVRESVPIVRIQNRFNFLNFLIGRYFCLCSFQSKTFNPELK